MATGVYGGPFFKTGDLLYGLQTGIEYRYWNRKLEPMKEKYRWLYVPVIAQAIFQVTNKVRIGCLCAYRYMVSGSMEIDFGTYGDMMGEMDIPVLTLGKKHGFAVKLPLRTELTHIFGIEYTPWFELRPSGISNVDTMRLYNGVEEQKLPFLCHCRITQKGY